MGMEPVASTIEIIERGYNGDQGLVPNEVRINGVSVLTSLKRPVVINEIEIPGDDLVEVTVTFIAKRLVVAGEWEE